MHGRPRKTPSPEDEKASALKAAKLRSLQSEFLQNHHNKIYTKEALEISAKLLEINPEFYTAWNYRKLAVEDNLKRSEIQSDSNSIESILNEELRVVENALRKNFKSYGAWHHRKWVLNKGHSSIDRELQLLEVFQKRDGRNFHAWNYRRFVAALKKRSDAEELQFTTDMINTNFSNYSAWHNRSVLLSRLLEERAQGFFPKDKVLTDEFDLVHQAIFTDPDDQSGWFYHLWLLDQTVKVENPLLVSSWPARGAELSASVDNCLDGCALSTFLNFHPNTKVFPLVLYFNEAVEGVNSTTVSVESAYEAYKDLIWSPLSTNNSRSAPAWVTYLKFPVEKPHSPNSYPLKVSIGHSQGIISSSSSQDAHPSCFMFTVCGQPYDTEHSERQGIGMISWRDENFLFNEINFQERSPINSFDQRKVDDASTASKWSSEIVANEIALFRELLSEINCKIGKITLARLLTALDAMMSHNKTLDAYGMAHFEEVLELFDDLMKLDIPHFQYYKDEYSCALLRQVTSSRESLLRHCCRYKDLAFASISNIICLRLSSLSLSRIGSVEKLLWVQMLDLSHNQLHSIEGLEALQLLSCLNLSNNKLGSFTALEPLRVLKSLKVLHISYNEIGAHYIDTSRYLCCSPLSHTAGSDWKFDQFVVSGVKVTNYWEAFSIFKDLNLTQLDIVGNQISDERFKLFLFELLPSLKWLDGVELR